MKEVEAIRKLTDEAVVPGRARLGGQPSEPRLRVYSRIIPFASPALEEVEVHGSWAFTRGSYRSVLIPKDRRPAVEESGKYLEIFEARGPGSVEVLQNIWNSDR